MSKNIKYHHSEEITIEFIHASTIDSHLDKLIALTHLFFEQKPNSEYFDRLRNVDMPLVIVARLNDHAIIGCKIGFQTSIDSFYSWIGGVHPHHRRQGIAQSMMQVQFDWCKEHKYTTIRTKTHIHNSAMYNLNFKNGYRVIGNDLAGKHGRSLILSRTLHTHLID